MSLLSLLNLVLHVKSVLAISGFPHSNAFTCRSSSPAFASFGSSESRDLQLLHSRSTSVRKCRLCFSTADAGFPQGDGTARRSCFVVGLNPGPSGPRLRGAGVNDDVLEGRSLESSSEGRSEADRWRTLSLGSKARVRSPRSSAPSHCSVEGLLQDGAPAPSNKELR